MSIGPLRRSVGALGLLALVPVAAMLVAGTLDPVDAAQRALLTLIAVLVLGRVANWGVHRMATAVERTASVVADGQRRDAPRRDAGPREDDPEHPGGQPS